MRFGEAATRKSFRGKGFHRVQRRAASFLPGDGTSRARPDEVRIF